MSTVVGKLCFPSGKACLPLRLRRLSRLIVPNRPKKKSVKRVFRVQFRRELHCHQPDDLCLDGCRLTWQCSGPSFCVRPSWGLPSPGGPHFFRRHGDGHQPDKRGAAVTDGLRVTEDPFFDETPMRAGFPRPTLAADSGPGCGGLILPRAGSRYGASRPSGSRGCPRINERGARG